MVSKVDQTVDFQNFHPTTVDFSKKVSQQSIYDQKSTVDLEGLLTDRGILAQSN
jgi:hypothetical protein